MACVALLLGAIVVPAMTVENSYAAWRRVFVVYAIVLVVCNTFFVIFTGAEPAKWTMEAIEEAEREEEEAEQKKTRTLRFLSFIKKV